MPGFMSQMKDITEEGEICRVTIHSVISINEAPYVMVKLVYVGPMTGMGDQKSSLYKSL
jgi:hypothetical protein